MTSSTPHKDTEHLKDMICFRVFFSTTGIHGREGGGGEVGMVNKTKKLVVTGMLCALAYLMTLVMRIPIVLFLRYDSKDIVIAAGGFLFGPLYAFYMSLVVSVAQMLTTSGTGLWGCLMNILSSCSFACTASFFYKRKRTASGAAAGLLWGAGCMVIVMLFWNYLIAPVYMGYTRDAVAELLLPAFLPFNLIKGGLNAAGALLLYRPVTAAARRFGLLRNEGEPDTAC